jgi:hypothetical protein
MTLAFLQSPIRFAFGLLACLFLATLVGLAHAETPTRLDRSWEPELFALA